MKMRFRIAALILVMANLVLFYSVSLSDSLEEVPVTNDAEEPVNSGDTGSMTEVPVLTGAMDLLPESRSRSIKGLNFTSFGNGSYMVAGSEVDYVNFDLFSSKTSMPDGVSPGRTYYLKYSTEDPERLVARVYVYDADGNVERIVHTTTNQIFTIPRETVGIIVRVYCYSIRNSNGTHFSIALYDMDEYYLPAPLSTEREKNNTAGMAEDLLPEVDGRAVKGLIYTKLFSGHYLVNGSESSFVNFDLFSSKNSFPDGVSAGGSYYLRYFTDNGNFRARVYWYDTDGNEIRIVSTDRSAEFTIPAEAVGMIVRVYCGAFRDCRNVHFEIAIFDLARDCKEAKAYKWLPRPMLTIIDDDGRVGFMNDLLPIVEELNATITTANTTQRTELREVTDEYLQAKNDYREGRISEEQFGDVKEKFDSLRTFLGANGEPEDYGLRFMSWAEIIECQRRGAEVVSHTYAHRVADGSGSVPERQIQYEYQLSKNALAAHGIFSDVVVYSNGSGWNGRVRAAASRVFKFGIDCPSQEPDSEIPGHDINYVTGDPHRIIRYNGLTDFDGMNESAMHAFMDSLVTGRTGWAVWMIHTSDPSWSSEKAGIIRSCIAYAQQIGLPVVTAQYGATEYFDTSFPQEGIYR